ncbi:MAG: SUMF1/EgtB/PvdO family nonheme iron enzyme, partial [Acidimicrobiia bacterium]
LGTYAEGRDEFPVGGVSWYEAAAYCAFAGKSLPTAYHWFKATGQDQLSDILRFSNFGVEGPSAVGSHQGLGDYGTYDMAGNVKEWTWNATGDKRYILGGSWGEPTYMYKKPELRRPFDRTATHGFRCARYEATGETMAGIVTPSSRQFSQEEPVADEVFEVYRSMYAYDRTDLEAAVEAVDDSSPHWRKEKVSFNAAYGNERVTALLFLPRNAAPPYQAVIWYPGSDAFFLQSSESLASAFLFDFIPRSGRALVYPIYKGMYERHVPLSFAPNEWRDMMIHWSKDIGRTIDYLETRPDIDHGKLAYYGFSGGAVDGPIFTAIDGRFRASVLLGAGIGEKGLPAEMQVHNFAPRSRVPTLMVSGRDDFIFPVESFQRPFLRHLGAPEADKRHALLEGGHIPSDRREIIKEVLDWLDRYLGPVGMANAN